MLDADVLPKGKDFIEKIIEPILYKHASLVGAATVPVKAKTFVEHVLVISHLFKQSLYVGINKGNVYLCHGRARAFQKSLYKRIRWPEDAPEDAYSYLFCKKEKMQFVFTDKAEVFFRCPTTIAEHAKQRLRFLDGRQGLVKHFGKESVTNAFAIPFFLIIKTWCIYFLHYPVAMTSFLCRNAYVRYGMSIGTIDHAKHQVAVTSKNLSL